MNYSYYKFPTFLLCLLFSFQFTFAQDSIPIITEVIGHDSARIVHKETFKLPKEEKIEIFKNRFKADPPEIFEVTIKEIDIAADSLLQFKTIDIRTEVIPAGQPKLIKASKPSKKGNAFYDIRFFNEEHGLVDTSTLKVFKDSKGMVWISTQNGRLFRYDGQYFAEFTEKQGFKEGRVINIFEDSKGNIWFSDQRNPYIAIKYDGYSFTYYYHIGENVGYISDIVEDTQGNILFSATTHLFKFDGENFQMGLRGHFIRDIEVSKNHIWLGTKKGLFKWVNNKLYKFTLFGKEQEIEFMQVQLRGDDLWIKGYKFNPELKSFFGKLKDNTFISYSNDTFFKDERHFNMKVSNHNVWITSTHGLIRFDGNYFTKITVDEGLTFNHTAILYMDSENNLWITGILGGLNVLKEGIMNLTGKYGFERTESIMSDEKGNTWFGVTNNGLFKYDGAHFFQTNIVPESIFRIQKIFKDSRDRIWVLTTRSGLYCIDKGEVHVYDIKGNEDGIGTLFSTISEHKNGDLIIGTFRKGLYVFNGEEFTHYNLKTLADQDLKEEDKMNKNTVYSSVTDSNGKIWLGTDAGVVSYENGVFKDYSKIIDIKNKIPFGIQSDKNSNLWVGTSGGVLYKYDGKNVAHYSMPRKSKNNGILNLYYHNDELWIGTVEGLNYINAQELKKDLNSTPSITSFNRDNGIKGVNTFSEAISIDAKGRLWLGTRESLTMLSPQNLKANSVPILKMLNIEIKNNHIDFGNEQDGVKDSLNISFKDTDAWYNIPNELNLPYSANRLKFQFVATEWNAPFNIKYQTWLEGIDEGWSSLTEDAEIEYSLLPYGNYTLKVRAKGQSEIWSEPISYAFTVLPPWWHTWWARTGYALIVILIIMGIINLRTNSINKQKIVLELIVKKRTEKISSQKKELKISMKQLKKSQSQLVQSEKMSSLGVLTAGIAHEINNPLNFISSGNSSLERDVKDLNSLTKHFEKYIKKLPQKDQDEWEVLKSDLYFDELQESIPATFKHVKIGTSRVVKIVQSLRTFSRLDESDLRETDIHEDLDSTLLLLKSNLTNSIKIIKNYDPTLGLLTCYPGPLNQVFMNLLSNATDAIDGAGTITIKTLRKEKAVFISIKDTGTGIHTDVLDKIFDPFYTTKEIGKGTGLGLSISQGIIEKHGGKLTVKSTKGKGSEFVIKLPQGQIIRK